MGDLCIKLTSYNLHLLTDGIVPLFESSIIWGIKFKLLKRLKCFHESNLLCLDMIYLCRLHKQHKVQFFRVVQKVVKYFFLLKVRGNLGEVWLSGTELSHDWMISNSSLNANNICRHVSNRKVPATELSNWENAFKPIELKPINISISCD